MGFRYRRSVKLGGLRINFSKSGIGYSYGVKGLRYTKAAKGKDRVTASIPGTGISYVAESGGKKKSSRTATSHTQQSPEPVRNYPIPLAVKLLAVVCGMGFAIYYATQGQTAGLSIGSGVVMGGLSYLLLCFLYGIIYNLKPPKNEAKGTDTIVTNDSAPTATFEIREESLKLAGSYHYKTNIAKVAVPNPDWRKTCKALVNAGMAGQKIYRFCRTTKTAELVEEPDNAHDPNAVMVTVEGEKVGYISADEVPHIKEILHQHDLKEVAATITGGEYKTITPDAEMIKNQNGPFVTVNIRYQ